MVKLLDEHWPQSSVGIIVVRDGKVLVGKRKGKHQPGTWAMPGGKQEPGEPIEETARRELFEETGLVATEVKKAQVFTDSIYEDEGRHYVCGFVLATAPEGEPELKEPDKMEEWRWTLWDEVPEPRFPAHVQLLEQGYRPPGT